MTANRPDRPRRTAFAFLGLEPPERDGQDWVLPVTRGISSGFQTLYGGAALAAGIEALERAGGRPLAWATAQFVSFARPPARLTLHVDLPARGRSLTQGRVLARDGDREVFSVVGALGRTSDTPSRVWRSMPDVAPATQCPPRKREPWHLGSIAEMIDVRLVDPVTPGVEQPRTAFWVKVADLVVTAATLGIIGDHVTMAMARAAGYPTMSRSLDNTLRVHEADDAAEWVLVEVEAHALHDGLGHGLAHLWSDAGTYLGVASQTASVRRRPD